MLHKDFFNITKKNEISENEFITEIKINKTHKIFNGHFPNHPVVPGVVSLQIITEILSKHLNIELMTKKAKSIKFSAIINPMKNSNLNVQIKFSKNETDNYKVNAKIYFDKTVFLKFNGLLSQIK